MKQKKAYIPEFTQEEIDVISKFLVYRKYIVDGKEKNDVGDNFSVFLKQRIFEYYQANFYNENDQKEKDVRLVTVSMNKLDVINFLEKYEK